MFPFLCSRLACWLGKIPYFTLHSLRWDLTTIFNAIRLAVAEVQHVVPGICKTLLHNTTCTGTEATQTTSPSKKSKTGIEINQPHTVHLACGIHQKHVVWSSSLPIGRICPSRRLIVWAKAKKQSRKYNGANSSAYFCRMMGNATW